MTALPYPPRARLACMTWNDVLGQVAPPEAAEAKADMKNLENGTAPGEVSAVVGLEETEDPASRDKGLQDSDVIRSDLRSAHRNSFRSVSSESESIDVFPGNLGEQLVYVHQLRDRMAKEQVEMRSLIRCVA